MLIVNILSFVVGGGDGNWWQGQRWERDSPPLAWLCVWKPGGNVFSLCFWFCVFFFFFCKPKNINECGSVVHGHYLNPEDGHRWLNLGTAPYCSFGASPIPRLLLHPQESTGSRGEKRGGTYRGTPLPHCVHVTACSSHNSPEHPASG